MTEARSGSLRTGLQVLDVLCAHPAGLGVTELAARIGKDKGNLHRLLRILEEEGHVQQDLPTKRYRPTVKIVNLASSLLRNLDLLEIDTEFYAADDVIEITGTHGVLWVTRCMGNMLGQSPVVLYKDGTFQHFDDVATGWDVSFLRSTQDFVTSMMNGSSPLLSGPQGREILSWCLAAEASAASGRQIAIFE